MNSRIILITGGSRGLGRNAALHLARQGADILLTYVANVGEAETAVRDIQKLGRRARALRLDVGNSSTFEGFAGEVRSALQAWGAERLQALVNNAGIGIHAAFEDTTEEQFDRLMAVHLKGTFFLTRKLLPLIADGGRIVNLSSGLARFSLPGYSAYATMKGGVEVLRGRTGERAGERAPRLIARQGA